MTLARTFPTLRSRILEVQSRRAYTADPFRITPKPVVSYTERYRGTQYATPRPAPATPQPSVSRGRVFVLLSGLGAVAFIACIVAVAPV
jgi:hypothetical protein